MFDINIAIIDLGSNSLRMSIINIKNKSHTLIEKFRENVRLSEGMGDEKLLQPNAISRTIKVMKDFKAKIDEHKIDKVYAIATAAVRTCKNPEAIIDPVFEQFGIKLEVISGEEEAYYDYMGVVNTLDVKDCVIIDIGGASTELILVRSGIKSDLISLPIGAVNITEKYFSNKTVNIDDILKVKNIIKKIISNVSFIDGAKGLDVVGIGGSVRALGKINKNQTQGLHGLEISCSDLFELSNKLCNMSVDELKAFDGIGVERADIMYGGLIPLNALMEVIDSKCMIVCESGLRDGVLYDTISDGKVLKVER